MEIIGKLEISLSKDFGYGTRLENRNRRLLKNKRERYNFVLFMVNVISFRLKHNKDIINSFLSLAILDILFAIIDIIFRL